jgi:hypothetical protein
VGASLAAMLRASFSLATLLALLGLVFAVPAGGVPGGDSDSPATSVYTEQAPAASGSSGGAAAHNAAISVYTEQVSGAGGTVGRSSSRRAAPRSLKALLTSSSLGAPRRVQPLPGEKEGKTYGTFSFQTVREVAGVGAARLAGLLAVLVLISVGLGAAALSRLSKR